MTLTQEQILETLERLRWYAYHFYYGPEARSSLSKHVISHDGRQFSISLRDDGNFEIGIKDSPTKIVYEARMVTAPLQVATSLDNLSYEVKIANVDELSEADHKWAHEVEMFVLSTLQRTNAFIFLARSQDVTLNRIAQDLAKIQPATAEEAQT